MAAFSPHLGFPSYFGAKSGTEWSAKELVIFGKQLTVTHFRIHIEGVVTMVMVTTAATGSSASSTGMAAAF